MSFAEEGALPAHCRLVSILPHNEAQPVRLCAVVQQPHVAGAPAGLVLLGSSSDGRAYLGALADERDRLHAWLEIWVQTTAGPFSVDPREIPSNPESDARWKRWATVLQADPTLIFTGWENVHPLPVWLDQKTRKAVVPRDAESEEPYQLCTDDAVLAVAGLESFTESRFRFLAVKGHPAAGILAPAGEVPAGTRPVTDVFAAGGDLIPFNPEGGFLLVRRLAPLEWDAFAGLLSGKPFQGLSAGRPPIKLGGPYADLDDWDHLQQSGAYLFSTSRGRTGRFHETFHLKLRLFLSMLKEVRALVAGTQLPCLNLEAGAFRVELSAAAGALPVLWTARAVLSQPSAATPLTAPGELRYFKRAGAPGASIYRPEGAGRGVRGRGELRIRKVMQAGTRIQIEATLVSPEVAAASPRDLVWARLPLPGAGTLDLVGNIDAAEALAQGEARFRTSAIEASAALLNALKGMEGAVYPSTTFETIPVLSTPVDLFALGVLGVQLFLAGSGKPLPTALDELLSLVRAVQAAGGEGDYSQSFRRLTASEPRWTQLLGPEHHGHGATATEEISALLPAELWWDTLATLGRFFPGASAQSFCRDFGDAPAYQLEAAFDAPLAAVEALVLRSQSLLLCDWPSNREIARVIQKVR